MSQLDLLENQPLPSEAEISDAKIKALKDKHAALVLCMNFSCLEDKEIYGPLGLDQAQFSRIKNGSMNFPPNKEDQLMDVCGNEIPLRYSALVRGKELIPMRSTLEQMLADKDTEIELLKHENEVGKRYLREVLGR